MSKISLHSLIFTSSENEQESQLACTSVGAKNDLTVAYFWKVHQRSDRAWHSEAAGARLTPFGPVVLCLGPHLEV